MILLVLLALAAGSGLAAPWPLAVLMLAAEVGRSASTVLHGVSLDSKPPPPSACPSCHRQWRDLDRHLAFAHQETVVLVLP
jgi:hypothetical protein